MTWEDTGKTHFRMHFVSFKCFNCKLARFGSLWLLRSSLKQCSSTTFVLTVSNSLFTCTGFWFLTDPIGLGLWRSSANSDSKQPYKRQLITFNRVKPAWKFTHTSDYLIGFKTFYFIWSPEMFGLRWTGSPALLLHCPHTLPFSR